MFQKRCVKKSSLILAITFLFVIVLSGCGSQTNSPGTTETADANATNATEDATSSPENLPFVKLTYYITSSVPDVSRQSEVEANFNKILKEKLNCELNFKIVTGDSSAFAQKLNLLSASGEEYDLLMAGTGQINLSQEVVKKTIIPLDDLLNKYAPAVLEKVDEKYFGAATLQGKRYAIPHPFAYAITNSFAFQKELVEKYGLDVTTIKKYTDLAPYLEKIKAGEPGIIPLYTFHNLVYDRSTYDELSPYIGYFPLENKVKTVFDDPATVEQWKALSDYFKKGYIAKDQSTKTDITAEIKSGRYAVYVGTGVYSPDGSKSTNLYGIPSVEALADYNTCIYNE